MPLDTASAAAPAHNKNEPALTERSPARTFHLFPELPVELREAIWRLCIPKYVCGLDWPNAEIEYNVLDGEATPCTLKDSTAANFCPPTITRVCFESRSVALKVGLEDSKKRSIALPSRPNGANWCSGTHLGSGEYIHRACDLFHLYWRRSYDALYDSISHADEYSPLHYLAAEATYAGRASIPVARLGGYPSFSWEYQEDPYAELYNRDIYGTDPYFHELTEDDERYLSAFERLSSYLVVLQIVVIHTDFHTGAATGLFGLLGDAPIQIVDMEEEAQIDRYFKLAGECENQSPVSVAQDLERRPLDVARRRLREKLILGYGVGSERLIPMMRPGIMFRLCTFMCNHPGQKRVPLPRVPRSPSSGPSPSPELDFQV